MSDKNNLKIPFWFIITLLFVEGFVGLSYQMLYIRQMVPVIGSNIIIVSWIVGMFLLFLAIGYRQGGRFSGNVKNKLAKNFIIAGILSGLGLSNFFVSIFFEVFSVFGHYYSLILYSSLIVAPTAYLLGQTLPLITNHMPENVVSKVSGDVLFFSTIGSFLGAVLGTNILVHYLGVAETIFISTFALLLLACFLNKKAFVATFVFIPILFIFTIQYQNQNYIETNEYGSYSIRYFKFYDVDGKFFMSNGSLSSFIGDKGEKVGYIKTVRDILFNKLALENKDILTLGAGGFILSHEINNNNFTYVDIDPEIKRIVEEHYLEEPINGEFVGEDARNYLIKNEKKYDLIFLDAYTGMASIPEHLSTTEFFQLVKNNLKEDGILLINSIADFSFESKFSRAFIESVSQSFPYCYIMPENFRTDTGTNIIYLCYNKERVKPYTDNLNNSGKDFWESYLSY